LLAGLLFGCNKPADALNIDFTFPLEDLPPTPQAAGAIVFLVDGVNATTFQSLLDANELPTIRAYFLERGLYVPHAVASHPSLTINNLTSIVTGRSSGHNEMAAPKWFDRRRLIFRNFETLRDKNKVVESGAVPTLYEQFPGCLTFSLFLQPHRGATHFFENRMSAGLAMIFEVFDSVDRLAVSRFREVMDIAREYRQFPAVCTVYQLSVDFAAYKYSASSEEYRQAIRDLDHEFGQVIDGLKRAGLLDRMLLAFVSDHGHCDTPLHGKVGDLMQSLGIKLAKAEPLGEEKSFAARLAYFGKVDAVPYGSGDRYWGLYLRKPIRDGNAPALGNWLQRVSPEDLRDYPTSTGKVDLPAVLAEQPYVDAVAYRVGVGSVRVVRKGGEVEFRRVAPVDGDRSGGAAQATMTYHVIRGTDPLEWSGKVPAEALAGRPLTSRQWLEATAATQFPDLGTGLLSSFDGEMTMDVVVFSAPQWDFDGSLKAGHGGIRDFEMFSPMLIAGPGIPHGRIAVARTVDLMPTLLEALGKPVPPGLDGESLIPRVRP
jgi:hypothetical protein